VTEARHPLDDHPLLRRVVRFAEPYHCGDFDLARQRLAELDPP
jgi:hypothetical protein